MSSQGTTLIFVFTLCLVTPSVIARPPYGDKMAAQYNEFQKKYPDVTGNRVSCSICHTKEGAMTNFRKRNSYGIEVGKGLKEKNDVASIESALRKAAAAASDTKGKTFGDLIEALERPGKNPKGKSDVR